ncbi:MAG: hypothetical protein ACKO9D_07705 [Gammaproteobacteria bacterium]
MLALKLLLVPALLAVVTLAGRRWGQRVAGWLGSFPIVAGPILLILTLENGASFGAAAAERALAAVAATMGFFVLYARLAPRLPWPVTAPVCTACWLVLVAWLGVLPQTPIAAASVATVALLLAPRAMGSGALPTNTLAPAAPAHGELLARMLAGATLVLFTSGVAADFGPEASGHASLFPVVGGTAAVSNHARQGAGTAVDFLRGTHRGMWSVAVFCGVLSLALPRMPVAAAFGLTLVATVATHALTLPRRR